MFKGRQAFTFFCIFTAVDYSVPFCGVSFLIVYAFLVVLLLIMFQFARNTVGRGLRVFSRK